MKISINLKKKEEKKEKENFIKFVMCFCEKVGWAAPEILVAWAEIWSSRPACLLITINTMQILWENKAWAKLAR